MQRVNNKTQFKNKKSANSQGKSPSKLGILILAIATIILYNFGINKVSYTMTCMIKALIQNTVEDY